MHDALSAGSWQARSAGIVAICDMITLVEGDLLPHEPRAWRNRRTAAMVLEPGAERRVADCLSSPTAA
jgi:uncharacterized protein YjeT (DUF2065 family)